MFSKLYLLFLVGILFSFSAFSKVAITIEHNVSRSDIPADDAFVKEEKDIDKIIATYHGGKNCLIKIHFIDPSPYPSYVQWLVDWWNSAMEEEEVPGDIDILFTLTENDKWKYEGIKIKPGFFFNDYYLEKIQEYVKEHLWEGVTNETLLVKRWLKAIKNILDQQYKQKLLTEGANLINVVGYKRGYRLSEWMSGGSFEYNYNLEPYVADSILTKNTFYISNLNEAGGWYLKTINSYFEKFDYHNPYQTINELETKIWFKTDDREDHKNKIPNHKLIDTNVKSDTSFHLKNRDQQTKRYRLKFTKTPIGNNEKYNLLTDLIVFGWIHTNCNFFVFDLQKKVWGKFLWHPYEKEALGSTAISNYLPTDPNFKEIPVIEASKYAEHGFYVICVRSGHVTTMYPDGVKNDKGYGHVVQAGSEIGNDIFLNKAWKPKDFGLVKAYMYLGHLFQ